MIENSRLTTTKYETPTIVELGSIADLTGGRGNGRGGGNGHGKGNGKGNGVNIPGGVS